MSERRRHVYQDLVCFVGRGTQAGGESQGAVAEKQATAKKNGTAAVQI
jgi:hypothetical protein